ncbi:LAQU0S02e07338g1_1 [Lachancea quebecensis]|uniref:LAQU0S02e07338g1_1 n=1 Tax=Lachancea quebecensis TaxID=1654605 RepID=A0A0N7ML33_9SACH|nr:LAQU0S02e07338g1_1 [Lachancea quebecensis]
MGIKRFFKIKPPEEDTPEINRDNLIEQGIPTKNVNKKKKEKFAAYGKFAKDKAEDKFYAPPGYENFGKSNAPAIDDLNKSEVDSDAGNVYMREPSKNDFDPYARNNFTDSSAAPDPYGKQPSDPYGSQLSDPYGKQSPDPYSRGGGRANANQSSARSYNSSGSATPYADPYTQGRGPSAPTSNAGNTYGQRPGNPYAGQSSFSSNAANATQPSQNPYSMMKSDPYSAAASSTNVPPPQKPNPYVSREASTSSGPSVAPAGDQFDFETSAPAPKMRNPDLNDDEIDLNATLQDEGDDLNGSIHEVYGGEQSQTQHLQQPDDSRGYQTFEDIQRHNQEMQQQQEDEEVDEIKQQIRFTKQSSVASTRNTLKMAQEAEMAGTNTLGMLGHQSEKLNNVERNLDLMKMQNRVADDRVAELKRLNRNILAVHVSNPFTSKRRLREAEERIRNQRIEDKLMQKQTNGRLHQSTNRIEGALNGASQDHDTIRQRYQNQAILEKAKRYQFENDEEDDEMEMEIDKNLDKVGQISGRLKRLAIAAGDEIDAQQNRVKNIEEDTDNMDIKIHLNTTRLTQIR